MSSFADEQFWACRKHTIQLSELLPISTSVCIPIGFTPNPKEEHIICIHGTRLASNSLAFLIHPHEPHNKNYDSHMHMCLAAMLTSSLLGSCAFPETHLVPSPQSHYLRHSPLRLLVQPWPHHLGPSSAGLATIMVGVIWSRKHGLAPPTF